MPEQYKALQGFKDILPDEQPYWRMVERAVIEVATLYGYRRIETPCTRGDGCLSADGWRRHRYRRERDV